jgi:hypothetical protein
VAADAGKRSGFEVRQEFSEIAFVLRESHQSSDAVALSGLPASAFHGNVPQFASHCFHRSRAFGEAPKIDF